MKRETLFTILLSFFISSAASAQLHCISNELENKLKAAHPEILKTEALLDSQIKAGLKKIDFDHFAKTTKTTLSLDDTEWYDIPIVVHVIHDYGPEYAVLSDDSIISALKGWNITYAEKNADTADVIAPFKKYIGNPHIKLHFATKDPNGNPTKGITHYRSYQTHNASDYAKYNDWPPQSYINIWFINKFGTSDADAAAYAYQPPTAAVIPYYDGVIALYSYLPNDALADQGGKTVNHEIGHVFNLEHTWGNTNNPEIACGDDDVDDTPPTKGHYPHCSTDKLYDTTCALGYGKSYPSSIPGIDSFVDYPDTANSQNIMDYTYCAVMFTKGQVYRMHAAMQNDVAGRNNLWSASNLAATGALQPIPDLPMVADFSVAYPNQTSVSTNNFVCPGKTIDFINRSWNDTLVTTSWTFSNAASIPTSTNNNAVAEQFSQPGWVTVNLSVTGNNTATSTITDSAAVFVADATATNPDGYYQEFSTNGDLAKWPMFNYYKNNFKWQLANVGYYDNTSIEYVGFDSRVFPDNVIGEPIGDYDDFFSIPFDLSGYAGNGPLNLNFMCSGATRTANSMDMNDTLEIDYSVDHAITWKVLEYLTKADLLNAGTLATAFTPQSQSDWKPESIKIPSAVRTNYTLFRFRYRPGATLNAYTEALSNPYVSTGNNFYMDRINISTYPAAVNNILPDNNNVVVAPNPTAGNAYVIIQNAANLMADITVMDITGKEVYTVSKQINGLTRVEIPGTALTVKGVYLVRVVTNNRSYEEKLVAF